MIKSLMNNARVSQVTCVNWEHHNMGYVVMLTAKKDYDFGMTDYKDPDEKDRLSKEVSFVGKTIDEALQKASDFLLSLGTNDVVLFNTKNNNIDSKLISQCKNICNKR